MNLMQRLLHRKVIEIAILVLLALVFVSLPLVYLASCFSQQLTNELVSHQVGMSAEVCIAANGKPDHIINAGEADIESLGYYPQPPPIPGAAYCYVYARNTYCIVDFFNSDHEIMFVFLGRT